MKPSARPFATYRDGVLSLDFGGSGEPITQRTLDVVINVDEFGTPTGVEVLHLGRQLGATVAKQFDELAREDKGLVGYDGDVDAASIRIGIASGSRLGRTLPEVATVSLNAEGRILSMDVTIIEQRET